MKKVFASILFIANFGFSAATINVAVIETEIDAGSDAVKEIKPAEIRYITQEIRRQATNNLPKPKYSIMTEQSVQAQGDAVLQECADENCYVTLGEKIGADFITIGTLSKFRKNYTLTVEIYDTRNGMLVVSSDPLESEKVEDLLIGFRKIAPSFFGKLDGGKNSTVVTPAPKQPDSAAVSSNVLKDSRDGQTYKTVKIGTQTWMAQNLNYDASGSKCYDNKSENCNKYGRLYNWETAKKNCPKGWHLPANEEWDKLYRYADGTSGTESPYESKMAGKYLKAKDGWNWNDYDNISGNGEDKFSFAALPGGDGGDLSGSCINAGINSIWWTSSEADVNYVYDRYMANTNEYAYWYYSNKTYLRSVRCVQD